jgi:hypothetical protein
MRAIAHRIFVPVLVIAATAGYILVGLVGSAGAAVAASSHSMQPNAIKMAGTPCLPMDMFPALQADK